MIIGTKVLVGIGLAGAGIAGLGVGGHFLLSQKAPKTIRDKITGKNPIPYYVKADPDNQAIKQPWTAKKDAYVQSGAQNVHEDILGKTDIDEEKLSQKCKIILETPLNPIPEDLNKKEKWATEWCFTS